MDEIYDDRLPKNSGEAFWEGVRTKNVKGFSESCLCSLFNTKGLF